MTIFGELDQPQAFLVEVCTDHTLRRLLLQLTGAVSLHSQVALCLQPTVSISICQSTMCMSWTMLPQVLLPLQGVADVHVVDVEAVWEYLTVV